MSVLNALQDFYKATVSTAWGVGTGKWYVSVKPTIAAGILVVSPTSATLREIIRYTAVGTDGGGDYVQVSARGLGGTTAQTHSINEPVRMNFTAEHWSDLDAVISAIIASGAPDATTTIKGVAKASVAPASAASPIFVGDNDPRVPQNAYGADSTGSDAYAITLASAPLAYAAGQQFSFLAGTPNTGAATLNVNGLGAKTIKKNVTADLATGDILVNQIVQVEYDGTNFQIVSKLTSSIAVVTSQVFAAGNASKNTGDASGTTQVIAHGLSVTPTKVRLKYALVNGTSVSAVGEGVWLTGGVYSSTALAMLEGGSTAAPDAADVSNSYALRLYTDTSNSQSATVAVDATNITLTWTKSGAPSGSFTFLWEAEGLVSSII